MQVHKIGLRNTVCGLLTREVEKWYEWRLGIGSSPYVHRADLGIDNPLCSDYAPADYLGLLKVLKALKVDAKVDVFLDYGSGMGRAVVVAATRSFRRVIGVELSPELTAIAKQNVERARKRLKCSVELVAADALSYELPNDVTIVFMFNPFKGDILQQVVHKIHTSLVKAPRKFSIIYMPPPWLQRTAFDECDWLVKDRVVRCLSGREYLIYNHITK